MAEGESKWRGIPGFFAANVLFGAGLFAHAFVYNFYLEGLAHGPAVMGNAAAALTAGGLVALVPAGLVVDRIGARAGYLIAVIVASAGLAAGAFVERVWAIYGAAALAGMGTATWRVSMGPLLMRLASAATRARAFSWNVGLLVGSGAVWTAASGVLPGFFGGGVLGYRLTLLLGALATLLASGVLFVGASRGKTDNRFGGTRQFNFNFNFSFKTGLRGIAIPPVLLRGAMWVAVWMVGSALVLPFFNIYFAREHGLDVGTVGLLLGGVQGVTALVLFGSGEMAARLGTGRMLTAWMLVFAPLLWGLGVAGTLGVAVPLFVLQGFVAPATNPLIDQVLLDRAPASKHGAVSSWRNAATEGGGLVGASAGGRILEAMSFGGLFAVAGGVALLGAVGLSAWVRRTSAAEAEPVQRASL